MRKEGEGGRERMECVSVQISDKHFATRRMNVANSVSFGSCIM